MTDDEKYKHVRSISELIIKLFYDIKKQPSTYDVILAEGNEEDLIEQWEKSLIEHLAPELSNKIIKRYKITEFL